MRIEGTDPKADTTHGVVVGELEDDGRVASFKGIPYAAPPIGDGRWRAPRPAERWSGERNATKHGAMAWQYGVLVDEFMSALVDGLGLSRLRGAALRRAAKLDRRKENEDCLTLTVRAPVDADGLPVMVWIHGGNHSDGSASDPLYATNTLPAGGCVLVCINYRLGVLGFLAHPELSAESLDGVSGNYGMLDQISALEWVRDNAAAFGGDPDNVTIFGESAGGQSVLNLMSSPRARGLFHRAIAQSPSHTGLWLTLRRPVLDWDTGERGGAAFGTRLVGRGVGQVRRLRDRSAAEVMALYRDDAELARYFFPMADGVLLPNQPMGVFLDGDQAPVPLLIGDTADEVSLFAGKMNPAGPELRGRAVTPGELRHDLERSYDDTADVEELLAAYPGLGELDQGAVRRHLADHIFGLHVDLSARQHAEAGHPVYRYRFASVPASRKQTAGAFHASDVLALFGSKPPLVPLGDGAPELSTEMSQRWVSFARNGVPDVPSRTPWPRFDPMHPQRYVLDRSGCSLASVPNSPGLAPMRRRAERLARSIQ